MTERNDIEEMFSSVFEGAEMTPPDSVKAAIDATLFSAAPAGKRKGLWWKWSLVLIVLFGITGTLVWMTYDHPEMTQAQIADGTNGNQASSHAHDPAQNTPEAPAQSTQSGQESTSDNPGFSGDENNGRTGDKVQKTQFAEKNGMNQGAGGGAKQNFQDKDKKRLFAGENLGGGDKKPTDKPSKLGQVPDGTEDKGLKNENLFAQHGENFSGMENQSFSEAPKDVNILATQDAETLPVPDPGTVQQMEDVYHAPVKRNNWELGLYAGTSFGQNKVRGLNTLSIEEQAGIYASAEAFYRIGRAQSLSFGLDFTQRNDRLIQTSTLQDSVLTGYTEIPVYDSSQVVIDTIFVPNYQPTSVQKEAIAGVRFYSIGVPINLHYTFLLGGKVQLNVGAGVRFSYMKYTNEDLVSGVNYPESYKQFGLNVALRPELLIPINRMKVGVYGRIEYDILNGMQWNAITRTRWSAGFGLSLRYTL